MADQFIRDLTAVSSLADTDTIPVDQGADAKKATIAQVKAAVGAVGLSLVAPTGTPNGVLTAFTLPSVPTGDIVVFINGVASPETDYSVASTTLTFGTAPLTGDVITVLMGLGAGVTPLADSDITGATSTIGPISGAQAKLAAQTWALRDVNRVYFVDDFIRYVGPSGSNIFNTNGGGTGAGISSSNTTNYAGHHGTVAISTGTTATGYYSLVSGAQQSAFSGSPALRKASTTFAEWVLIFQCPAAASDATNDYILSVGMVEGNKSANSFGIYYNHATNSGKWQIFSKQSSETSADSTYAFTADQWISLRITWNGTALKFYINGTQMGGDITTNIPADFYGPGAIIIKNAGTTARIVTLDLIQLYAEVSAR